MTQNGILPTQNSLQLKELKVKYLGTVYLILNLIAHKEVVCGTDVRNHSVLDSTPSQTQIRDQLASSQ